MREKVSDEFEEKIEVSYVEGICVKKGYLANVKQTTHIDSSTGAEVAAIYLYFVETNGKWFKAKFLFNPYFYILCDDTVIKEVIFYLNKTYSEKLKSVEAVSKEDLTLINHLSGKTQRYVKLEFTNEQDLMTVRKEVLTLVKKNQLDQQTQEAYQGWYSASDYADGSRQNINFLSKIIDIREYDISYQIRVQIDNEIRVGVWYEVHLEGNIMKNHIHLKEMLDKPQLRVLAFDIETTKQPLKFPDVRFDQVMMISYIIDGSGFLITNRQIVSQDIQNFEYAPKEEYDVGTFTVFNEPDEKSLLQKFFSHIRQTRPTVFSTFNGDNFDWPFIQARSDFHKIKMEEEIGVYNNEAGEFIARFASHMDCLYWVKRDAFLPQGSHGLKMVTKAKLGYAPVELDPELMLPYAKERPQHLAEYSVSDAVATYFLYMQQIHDFIFALCTIIPTNPDDVLRRGSGTLCENLLMAQAFRGNIIFPNKQIEDHEKFYKGKLIDSETYIGGHVECLRQGVYRSDFPVEFHLKRSGYQELIDKVSQIMDFALLIEPGHQDKSKITNYEEIKTEIEQKLMALRDQCPVLVTTPLIYHVDVGAMYPNIILTNRLQPTAIVNEQICAGCIFNHEQNNCKRKMNWEWKGEMFTLGKSEYEKVKLQLNEEEGVHKKLLSNVESQAYQQRLKQRVKQYCQGNFKKVHTVTQDMKTDTVCMRENPFYVDTVRDFRDRRYDFKRLVKKHGDLMRQAMKNGDTNEQEKQKNLMILYESQQLAHKIILNSFYGYVMRKAARWYSMEMAAMVTHTGGNIIMDSRALYDQIGMPLELDTDGIWTLLPKGFPESFTFKLEDGKTFKFDYPCTMSNELIYYKYGNPQYQTMVQNKKFEYDQRLEMSIFFEIDGPYKCMLIPASTEENKMLKKRYAVFNHAGKMTEVKGFELKRRGELQIIKIFQQEVFMKFLEGKNLQECYDTCGEVAQRWYDILTSKGEYVSDSELVDYIGESRVINKSVEEYGSQKSTAITCAKRLAEFLGGELAIDKGLNVKFIISQKPITASVTERSIPTTIFEADESVMKKYLKKWTGDNGMNDFDIRSIIDWNYYMERLAGTIQKIVTIPAALQNCMNPVPEISYPAWLHKRIKVQNDKFKQKSIGQFFKQADIEDIGRKNKFPVIQQSVTKKIEAEKQKQPALKIEDCPEPNQDFSFWLTHQKSNWRNIRQQLKQEKKLVTNKFNSTMTQFGGKQNQALTNFIHNMDELVINSVWHIVSIEQTFEPGILKLWAITSQGRMFNIRLQVGRTVYINSKVVSTESDFKKVQKDLPRGRRVFHLYEWETTEEEFQLKFNSIKYTHLLSNQIEGIYETKVPPKFRALMVLGNVVKPKKDMIPRNEQALGRTYKITELEVTNKESYLPQESYQRIYLLHSYTNNRHLWGLFIEATREICFYVVNPALKASLAAQGQLNLESVYSKMLTDLQKEVEFASWQVTDQKSVQELQMALKLIEQRIQEYKGKNKGATIVILQSDLTTNHLQFIGLPSLTNDFPVVKCPCVVGDNEFPALDWLRYAVKNMTARFTEVGEWLSEKIDFSTHTVMPICNLENDSQQFVIDTLYARSLYTNKHLLWYSEGSKPDLGGHEDKNYRLQFQDDIENPEINNKGFYRTYSIEINISHLALNTILCYDQMLEFEQLAQSINETNSKMKQKNNESNSMLNQAAQDYDNDLDEFVACAAAFSKLRGLISLWMQDKQRYDSEYAGELLMHFYKWLTCSSGSRLYDPLLHRMIHKMMGKNFMWLISSFKKLGCNLIYGSFQKIILQTTKKEFEEAQIHIEFVLSQIRNQSMFKHLDLQTGEFWQILLFKDISNYAGITESNPDKLFAELNVVKHLPESIRNKYKLTVMELCTKTLRFNRKKLTEPLDQEISKVPQVNESNKYVIDYMETVEDFNKEPDHEFICKLINEYFSQKLLNTVEEILNYRKRALLNEANEQSSEEYSEDEQEGELEEQEIEDDRQAKLQRKRIQERKQKELSQWEFPQMIGSYNEYSVPALEFAKMVCNHIFGLDASFSIQAQILLKNLLRILQVKEFSQEVVSGKEPSLTLVVPDVICNGCQSIIDLDICRNTDLYEDANNEIPKQIWPCKYCDTPLNKDQVERQLFNILNRRVISYQMQDLKCKACNMINNQIAKRYCQCTGRFIQTAGFELPDKLKNQNLLNKLTDIRLLIKLMRNFGIRHEMRMLCSSAENLLLLMP